MNHPSDPYRKVSPEPWEERYQSGDTPWDKGEASPGLLDFIGRAILSPGEHPKVLVPGCGLGHDAEAWARAGFHATGLDLAPTAIRRATDRTQAAALPLRFIQSDFLDHRPETSFDILFEHTLFCAIDPVRRPDYVEAVTRWLRPGGWFVAVHYLIPDTEGPPFGTTREEILTRFSTSLELQEDWVPRSYPHRTGLERMFLWKRPGGNT